MTCPTVNPLKEVISFGYIMCFLLSHSSLGTHPNLPASAYPQAKAFKLIERAIV